ncbi:MAG TPA: type II toxin-antitoxin system VapC family toxin, partial [Candidatus Bathyarchaeota archaeon]|nr:type II toxin-antitoxin system VapC family toxin [Candidatus Bathyarchaeota archaeon]
MRIVVDSYAWIELFIGSSEGEKVRERMLEADRVFTPGIVLAEIARKYHREGVEREAIRERLRLIVETSEIIPIDEEVALESASCYEELLS